MNKRLKEKYIKSGLDYILGKRFTTWKGGGISAWVAVVANQELLKDFTYCHARLTRVFKSKGGFLITSLFSNNNKEDAEYWWSFITDKEKSPWRNVLKDTEIVYTEDNDPYAIIFHNLDIDQQVMSGFLTASRTPAEFPSFVAGFKRLCESGKFDKYESLKAIMYMGYKKEGDLFNTFKVSSMSHNIFNPNINIDTDKLREGNPSNSQETPYYSSTNNRGTFSAWGFSGPVPDVFNDVKSSGKFKGVFKKAVHCHLVINKSYNANLKYAKTIKLLDERRDEWV